MLPTVGREALSVGSNHMACYFMMLGLLGENGLNNQIARGRLIPAVEFRIDKAKRNSYHRCNDQGAFYVAYLPHFHLGRAVLQRGAGASAEVLHLRREQCGKRAEPELCLRLS